MRKFLREFGPVRVAFVYTLFGALWILLSDSLAVRLIGDGTALPLVQTLKGLFYVAITTALVYTLARFSTRSTTEEKRLYKRLYMQDKRQLAALLAATRGGIVEPAEGENPLQALTETVAQALDVERVSVWRFNADRTALECRDLFERSREHHTTGQSVATADCPDYCRALATHKVIAADDALRDTRTREFTDSELKPHGITAMLDAPILIQGKVEGVLCLQHAGGARSWTHGEQALVVSIANLISLMKVQEDLRVSRRQLTTLMDNLPGAVYRCRLDTDWTTLFMSEGITALTGYRPVDFLDNARLTYAELIDPDDRDRVYRDIAAAAARGDTFEIEYRIRTREAVEKTVWERGRFFANTAGTKAVEEDEAGGEGYLEGFVLDITDRKQAEADRRRVEERLGQMQKLEAIGQLAGGVAHDFNNMLTIILVRAEMALRKMGPSDPNHASLLEIHDAAERSASLTRQLLTYARRQSVAPRPLSLNTFAEEALPMLNRIAGENITVAWIPGEDLWMVELDPSQVDQILVNLSLNARDALPGGGVIRLETRNAVLTEEDCRARPELTPGEHVLLSVSDTGSGMDEAVMARIFEPFFTTKEVGKGTGLGLPTVHGIMRQNHGAIEVDSAPGQGSTFCIYLPRHTVAAENEDAPGELAIKPHMPPEPRKRGP